MKDAAITASCSKHHSYCTLSQYSRERSKSMKRFFSPPAALCPYYDWVPPVLPYAFFSLWPSEERHLVPIDCQPKTHTHTLQSIVRPRTGSTTVCQPSCTTTRPLNLATTHTSTRHTGLHALGKCLAPEPARRAYKAGQRPCCYWHKTSAEVVALSLPQGHESTREPGPRGVALTELNLRHAEIHLDSAPGCSSVSYSDMMPSASWRTVFASWYSLSRLRSAEYNCIVVARGPCNPKSLCTPIARRNQDFAAPRLSVCTFVFASNMQQCA